MSIILSYLSHSDFTPNWCIPHSDTTCISDCIFWPHITHDHPPTQELFVWGVLSWTSRSHWEPFAYTLLPTFLSSLLLWHWIKPSTAMWVTFLLFVSEEVELTDACERKKTCYCHTYLWSPMLDTSLDSVHRILLVFWDYSKQVVSNLPPLQQSQLEEKGKMCE